jgi:alpha-glucuronidase
MKRWVRSLTPYVAILLAVATPLAARAEDGYDLWLRYRLVADAARLAEYRRALGCLVVDGDSPTLRATRDELVTGLTGLLGRTPVVSSAPTSPGR